jgi:hypothetical protein
MKWFDDEIVVEIHFFKLCSWCATCKKRTRRRVVEPSATIE